MDDSVLLQEYAQTGAEAAFATVVKRHVGLVYSAALRQVRDAQHAEDVTQAVFIVLARKAGQVAGHPGLSGWLLQTTRYAANAHIRTAARRAQREQEAVMQSASNESESTVWEQLAPRLDDALASLGATDRAVLALRYFENKSAAEIARELKLNEEAAQKRASRALDKLRKYFGKKGLALSAGAIAASLAANSVQAAPAGLAEHVSLAAAHALAPTASIAAIAKGTMKTMTWNSLKTLSIAGAALILVAGATTLFAQRAEKPVAQIPYNLLDDACRFADNVNQTNLVFRVLIGSNFKSVKPENIRLTIQSATKGKIPVLLGAKGDIRNFPHDDDLRRENPPIVSDQPKDSLGAGLWVYVPMPEGAYTHGPDGFTFRYNHLSNAVAEANKAADHANEMGDAFANNVQMMTAKVDGVVLVFREESGGKAKMVIATSTGAKEYTADAHGTLKLRINPKLEAENPQVTVSEKPRWIVVARL